MPAKGNVYVLPDGDPMAGVTAASLVGGVHDLHQTASVDHLVQEIKENLKLGSAVTAASLKAARASSHLHHHRHRSSPYAVPPSSRIGGLHCDSAAQSGGASGSGPRTAAERQSQLRKWNHQRRRYPSTCKADDDVLQDPFEMLQELIADGSLVKEAVRRLQLGLTPKYSTNTAGSTPVKNRSFYDSDDECRTPPAYPELCEVGGI